MAQQRVVELLTIARDEDPPSEATITRAFATAGLGSAAFSPGEPPTHTAAASGQRQRLGAYHMRLPAVPDASARLVVSRYDGPVMAGMAETAFNTLTRGLGADARNTLRRGTLALDLRLTCAPDPTVAILEWVMRALRLVLDATDGAAIDPAAQRCYTAEDIARLRLEDPLAHIAVHNELWAADSRWLHTHGLQKFARPELDLVLVPAALEDEGLAFLRAVATHLARGTALQPGQEVELEDAGTAVALGTMPDAEHLAPYGRLRLADVPAPGGRQEQGTCRLLLRVAMGEAARLLDSGNSAAALEALDRALAADPDDCAALALKARLHLRAGQAVSALEIGELMRLRVPEDYRGPLTVGLALGQMGRYREALVALDRAIEREPEAAEAFAARAEIHVLMGHEQQAAVDRARATYLRA